MAQVQWWDDWQLRVVVLASLTAQYFLVLFAGIRKFHIPPWLRVSFRLAHIGSDALAIFALATLFSRQKNGPRCSYVRGSRELELLWAPIVLMHLGGQVVTTTYKIEDNEQWSRHILTSLSKVTVALYVFYRSWSSDDKRLLIATILLFILVIIRCFQKALDLKSSSFNAIRKNSLSEISFVQGNFVTEEVRTGGYVKRARNIVLGCPEPLEVTHHAYPSLPYQLCLDFPCPYPDRLAILNKFWLLDSESAYRAIEGVLSAMTSFLYTKDDTIPYLALKNAPTSLIFRWCTQVLAYGTLVTVICLVHTSSHKEAYSGRDTRVTLVLLYGTLLLELVYLGVQTAFRDRFSGRILQRSLLGLLDHNRRYPMLRRMAGWLQCKDLVDKYFGHMEPSYSCKEITELIRCHVESGWKNCIVDTKSYRRFNDTRGEGTLASKLCLQKLGWSLKRPFDETIILWHLATDICFRRKDTSPDDHQCAPKCKEISNYMMHLLFHNPEMLMPGSRKSLFSRVYNELESILEGKQAQWDKRDFTRQLIETCDSHHHDDHIFSYISDTRHNPDSSVSDTYIPNSFIRDACLLAENLSCDIGHEIKMWEVIQGVWVEMLCFSASRSRGYLHAETLGTGVEYLSYAWVLLAYAGIETFPEKLQKREDLLFDSGEPSV